MTDDARPHLGQVNIVVRDMEAMAAFYTRLGLTIPAGPEEWQSHHRNADVAQGAHIDLDSSAFAAVWNTGWSAGRTGAILQFTVASADAVDRVYQDLTGAGYDGQQEPYDAFWGARYAVVADPDGNAIGLMSPIDPARRTAGPEPPGSP